MTVTADGVAVIAQRIHKLPVVIMGPGTEEPVPVILVGVAMIALSQMPVVGMEVGMLLTMGKILIAAAILVGVAAIVPRLSVAEMEHGING